MHFEIGPAAYSKEGGDEIILRDKIFCPKCKKEISDGQCIALSGELMMSMIAMTVVRIAGENGKSFKMPQHLQGIAIVSKDNLDKLKMESNGIIKLVASFKIQT